MRPFAALLILILIATLARPRIVSAQAASAGDTIEIVEQTVLTVGAEAQGLPVVITPMRDTALSSRLAARLHLPPKSSTEFLVCNGPGGASCRFARAALLVGVNRVTIAGDSANVAVQTLQPESSTHLVYENHDVFVLLRRGGIWRVTAVIPGRR